MKMLQDALIDSQRQEEFRYKVNEFNKYVPKYKNNFDLPKWY